MKKIINCFILTFVLCMSFGCTSTSNTNEGSENAGSQAEQNDEIADSSKVSDGENDDADASENDNEEASANTAGIAFENVEFNVVVVGADESGIECAREISKGASGANVLLIGASTKLSDEDLSDCENLYYAQNADIANIVYDGDGGVSAVNINYNEEKIHVECRAVVLSTDSEMISDTLTSIYKITDEGRLALTAQGMTVRKESGNDVPTKCGVPLVDPDEWNAENESDGSDMNFGVDLLAEDDTWDGSRVYVIGQNASGYDGSKNYMSDIVSEAIIKKCQV